MIPSPIIVEENLIVFMPRSVEGKGVPENYAEAYKWLLLATMNRTDPANDLANTFKEILRERMTLSQVEDAQRGAKEFLAQQERHSKEDD